MGRYVDGCSGSSPLHFSLTLAPQSEAFERKLRRGVSARESERGDNDRVGSGVLD